MAKPWMSRLRTHGSRRHGHCQRPQQTRWEFRRWDGALSLKAAGAPADLQTQHTQHGISEMRFETPGPLASVFLGGGCCGQLQFTLGQGKCSSVFLGQAVDWLAEWVAVQKEGRGVNLEVLNSLS